MTQAPPPAEPLDSSVRERLLQAAVDLFAAKGYASTSVREIVAAAGVTKPVLYYYFQSKEGIYLEIMNRASDDLQANLAALADRRGSVWERLLKLADTTYRAYSENIKTMQIMHAILFGPPQGAPFVDFNAVFWAFHEAVEAMVEEGMQSGEMLPGEPKDVTWVLMGTVHLAMEMALCQPERALDRQGLRRVLEVNHQAFWAGPVPAEKGTPS
jgi:TetR/AcrR family transcriptional regulator